MLPKKAVDPKTLALIIRLQSREYLAGFHLVGGTALALALNHRFSVDIDLFTTSSFETGPLLEQLANDFGFEMFYTASNTLKGSIDGIKIDLLAHRYPLLREPLKIDGVSMLSIEDIIAMKLNAISTSGQRVKDFIDIWFLFKKYHLREMLGFYRQKYSLQNDAIVLKSLIWFDDAGLDDWPVFLNDPPDWKQIRKDLTSVVRQFMRQRQ